MTPSSSANPIGLALGYDPAVTVRRMADSAAAAERAGFDTAFFSETLFTNRDSVSALAAFGLATRRVTLGATQVVRLRSPLVMAQSAATLDELSGGRLVLVLGAYTAKHAARNGRPLTDPVTTLREYVESIRALLTGEPVTYHGEVVRLDDVALNFQPLRPDIPIWIAAASRKGLVNAASIGDGVLLDAGTSPEYSANAVALLRASAEQAGRDPDGLAVAQLINTSIEDDRAAAIEAIRWEVATKFKYASTPKAKMSVGEPTIDPTDLPRFAATYEAGGEAALQKVLPERYVTSLTATGTVDDVRARVDAYRAAGVTMPLVRPAAPHQLDRLLTTFGQAHTVG
ncbi:LLM class flavin-dependent oxidoreductase [Micromonospora olivasterospora]|uniref:5,10-methylenetetrahydromethanopterin reductase n=1 Tax=Micromonospora olivasterospora TaxID=1880 RepID=A0A562IAX2_MICOL|nr:LLM class flavin-dependent oxidoreductase [Micromonospora olivasterospora]TWH68147.1 5,10-methylenetetrahydromethanopterin reductase [Micromonospora olivasterospora]